MFFQNHLDVFSGQCDGLSKTEKYLPLQIIVVALTFNIYQKDYIGVL
jgi:cell division protein FtsL